MAYGLKACSCHPLINFLFKSVYEIIGQATFDENVDPDRWLSVQVRPIC